MGLAGCTPLKPGDVLPPAPSDATPLGPSCPMPSTLPAGGFLASGGGPEAGVCLAVSGAGPRTFLELEPCDGAKTGQRFVLPPAGAISPAEDACLCLDAGDGSPGSTVRVAGCDGSPPQGWTIADGQLRPASNSGACLDGAQLALAACNAMPPQAWWPFGFAITVGSSEQTPAGGSPKNEGLSIKGAAAPGVGVDDEVSSGTPAQVFTLTARHEITLGALCLQAMNHKNPGLLELQTCTGTIGQSWAFVGADSGVIVQHRYFKQPNGQSSCLDVFGNRTLPGDSIDLAPCNGTTAQLWHPSPFFGP
jgi:hypothetical protein